MRIRSTASSVAARRARRRPALRRHRVEARRAPSALSMEIARLRAHFREVMGELRARDVAPLSPSQRATRALLLRAIERYARAGRFPRNLDFPGALVPYFVDAAGTRCAVAHLLEITGEDDLVARIRAAQNNAFVPQLSSNGELLGWLERAGLTAAEAARIEPSYCFVNKADACFCDSGFTPDGVAEVTVLMKIDVSHVHVRIDAVHGDAALATVGQEVDVSMAAEVGERVIVGLSAHPDGGMPSYGPTHPITKDGTVKLACTQGVPTLKKGDAINALLAPEKSMSSSMSACSEHLASVDSAWGESQCENGGGCGIAASGGASSLLIGTLVVGIAAWSRRRRRTAGARRRHRSWGEPPAL